MTVSYFEDTDTLYIALHRVAPGRRGRLDLDAGGRICSFPGTVHLYRRHRLPRFGTESRHRGRDMSQPAHRAAIFQLWETTRSCH